MFRRVVVGTDFSQGAAAALERVVRLPLADDARIALVHVLPIGAAEPYGRETDLALGRVVDRARAPVALEPVVLRGKPYVEIIRAARARDADLIVLGAHGERSLRDRLLGSTASRVIRSGDVPVLIVRRAAVAPYRDMLVAMALEDIDHRLIQLARKIGDGRPAIVHAVHVPFEGLQASTEEAREVLRAACCADDKARLHAFLSELEPGAEWSVTIEAGDIRSVVLETAARRGADLLVAGTHGRSGIAHALLGSVAETLIEVAPCDVLVGRPTRFTFQLP